MLHLIIYWFFFFKINVFNSQQLNMFDFFGFLFLYEVLQIRILFHLYGLEFTCNKTLR